MRFCRREFEPPAFREFHSQQPGKRNREPTLHPRLLDMIRNADQKGMKVKLHTNGTALTRTFPKG